MCHSYHFREVSTRLHLPSYIYDSLLTYRVKYQGSFDCVGKSIAWMELRDAISMITLEYDIKLSDESQRAFDGKESDNFTLAVPDLFMAFSRRH